MDLEKKIIQVRESKSISKADMAKALDMLFSNYHRLEKRGDKLTLEQIEQIAQALGVTVVELLTWGETEPQTQDAVEMAKQNQILKERVEELEEILDIQSQGHKMRRIAAKQLYDQYKESAHFEHLGVRQRNLMLRVIEYIGVLAEMNDKLSDD